ncbi:site-specific DNA-methyltransferase [uncultured Cohaesibacter sp.]|uniref:site-specific DNA-methyltransferase n=1 Tax=uncultured Cohaesibacter sp. TaxID=1002546 RepID=UPI002AA6EDFE|nr:site-specific DNA-methyltransferase [uncultured Cohaesibacter sp.]
MAKKPQTPKQVEALKHEEATRKNIPTAELQSVAQRMEEIDPFAPAVYPRAKPLANGEVRARDEDLDPQIVWNGVSISLTKQQVAQLVDTGKVEIGDAQLVWRGKDTQDWSDLVVTAPPLYIQEKIHSKAIIDDLKRQTKQRAEASSDAPDLFADFNGVDEEAKTEFYQHDQHWSNRMILGDSLQVMASLAEREQLRGKVQCIYFDPPYGIKFNSNWQVSTQSKSMSDQDKREEITRESEQIQAFRDTWKDGIHSYLTYLRDRLSVMRDLLSPSGSIFVQIGDGNVHRVRALLDEVFGEECMISEILVKKKGSQKSSLIDPVNDYILWYGKSPRKSGLIKYRKLFDSRDINADTINEFSKAELENGNIVNLKDCYDKDGSKIDYRAFPRRVFLDFPGARLFRAWPITNGGTRARQMDPVMLDGQSYYPPKGRCWSHTSQPVESGLNGMLRNRAASRLVASSTSLDFKRYLDDFPYQSISNWWDGFGGAPDQVYVVQTNERIIQRCILMATDPGDLVLDPTCGSGTTAAVAEHWGRRWITIDTSRVALALARTRLMSARFPYFYLADSKEGRIQEQKASGAIQPETHTNNDVRQGFVYRRCSYITSGQIANILEIDVIWDKWQETLESLRADLNAALGKSYEEWEIPREASASWSDKAKSLHQAWWEARIARQKEIDTSIAQKADVEMLYDRPYEDKSKIRVAGPFTVESLSPHRVIAADEDDGYLRAVLDGEAPLDTPRHSRDNPPPEQDFAQMVIENLKSSGVQQSAKEDKISFSSVEPWPGSYISADGRYMEGETEKRAGIFIGPEFGSVTRADLTAAAREAFDARFDVLIACGFNFDAHTSEFNKLGPLNILKAKMNPDLHMSDELKNTGAGNLFVVFGEPDIEWKFDDDGEIIVEVLGVDVFDPKTGEVRASGKDDIAAWFIDTNYNEESFFVRHAYFMGANDPYKSLKTALRAEIDEEAWSTLYRDTSRPFERPVSGRFAVKVINHFGDEVMKVFGV